MGSNWQWLITALGLGGLGAVGLLGWAMGLPAILRILASIGEVLAPIARAVIDAVVAVVSLVWSLIIRPGITVITSTVASTVLVISMVIGTYLLGAANWEIKERHYQKQISGLQLQLSKAKRPIPPTPPAPAQWEFKWPF